MKISRREPSAERRVLAGMISDSAVLGHIAAKWQDGDGPFRSPYANHIGRLCVQHHRRYGEAPQGAIEGLVERWAADATPEAVEGVDRVLAGLEGRYDTAPAAAAYLVDTAGELFNAVALQRLADRITNAVENGDVAAGLEAAGSWGAIALGGSHPVDVLNDREAIEEAFRTRGDGLVNYPGALGQFFGDQLGRDEFVAFTGATSRGKSWWLLEIAWQAVLRDRRRVAFFEVGDMSQSQIMRRFMARVAGRPLRPCTVRKPISIEPPGDGEAAAFVTYEEREYRAELDATSAWEAAQVKARNRRQDLLRLSCHPAGSLNVGGLKSQIEGWARDGWVPDVIVVDYADLLAHLPGYQPGDREGINATWRELRAMSQRYHCLVVTATQGDAGSYTAQTLRRGNFSDDRRKNDHVTAMIGLNANPVEQDAGILRLNFMKRREEVYNESRCVHVAGCLALARPHILSTF